MVLLSVLLGLSFPVSSVVLSLTGGYVGCGSVIESFLVILVWVYSIEYTGATAKRKAWICGGESSYHRNRGKNSCLLLKLLNSEPATEDSYRKECHMPNVVGSFARTHDELKLSKKIEIDVGVKTC